MNEIQGCVRCCAVHKYAIRDPDLLLQKWGSIEKRLLDLRTNVSQSHRQKQSHGPATDTADAKIYTLLWTQADSWKNASSSMDTFSSKCQGHMQSLGHML